MRSLISTSDGELVAPVEFTYNGHQIEIVLPDEEHLVGNFWQITIDGVLQRNVLYSSLLVAADGARELVNREIGHSPS